MSNSKPIKSALISVFNKDGLEPIVQQLEQLGVTIYSTREIESYTEATIVLQSFQERGVEQCKMLYVLNGEEIPEFEALNLLRP